MDDEISLHESDEEYERIRVPKEKWKSGAPLKVVAEEELLKNQKIYTPLRLFLKKDVVNPDRPRIPAKLSERLAFVRSYCSTPSKSYFVCWRDDVVHFLVFITVVFYSFFTCFAVFFIQIFLGIYAREHHLFVIKMVPLTYGMCAMYLFVSVLELSRFVDLCMIFLDYIVMGILERFPWNSCTNIQGITGQNVTFDGRNYTFQCMTINKFKEVFYDTPLVIRVKSNIFSCYLSNATETCNQIAQVKYLRYRGHYLEQRPMLIFTYFMMIWAACFAWHKQIYRRALFKAQTISHWLFVLYYSIVILQIKLFPDFVQVPLKPMFEFEEDRRVMRLSFDLMQLFLGAISVTPPLIHLLSARSEKVKAGSESLLMAFGNTVFLFFRIWVETEVHEYVDHILDGFVHETNPSCFVFPCLYYWLIYFGVHTVGNFYSLIFLFINLAHEYLTMVVTLQCLIEIYVVEFKFATRWATSGVVFALSLSLYMIVYHERHILTVFCRIVLLVVEFFAIFGMYPLRRLLDDMMFYYGTPITKYLYLNFLSIPTSEFLAVVAVVLCVHLELALPHINQLEVFILLLVLMAVPLIAGIFYTVILKLHFNEKLWTLIFCPNKFWGPDNFITRQLRKEFVSREFIISQGPRILGRYLMKNAEPDTYKLDVLYQFSDSKPFFSDESITSSISSVARRHLVDIDFPHGSPKSEHDHKKFE